MITRRTLNRPIRLQGVGLHGGAPGAVSVAPAAAGHGIVFHASAAPDRPIPARFDRVVATPLSTRLGNAGGPTVGMVEHLMAAFAAAGITDVTVMVEGAEVPAMDGSARPFLAAFAEAGLVDLGVPVRAIRIRRPVALRVGDKLARLEPAPGFEMHYAIAFADPAIGRQAKRLTLGGGVIAAELADSRTFGCLTEVEGLHRLGLGRGGNLGNVVMVDRGRVLNPEGLRHADEFVRHKMLDAVGDLMLAGAPIVGRYVGVRAGHALTNRLLRRLFATPDAWSWCDAVTGQVPGGPLHLPDRAPETQTVAV